MSPVTEKIKNKYTLLTVGEAAHYLSVHRMTIYRLIKRKEIPFVRLSSKPFSHIRILKELIGGNLPA